jgi:hypothetical protein
MTFVRRRVSLTFQLGTGTFGESGTNTVTVEGLRVQAHIDKVFGPGMGEAQIRVHGLTPSLMNQLSSLNQATMATRRNTIIVLAGDDISGMSTVFQGQIQVSQIMLNTAPDTALMVLAQAGAFAAVQNVPPSSYPGSANAAVIMSNLAFLMGYAFENNGVSVQLATPYFPGSPREQAQRCAEAGKFEWVIDDGTLAIFPIGGTRGGSIPLISPETGMVGYPNYSTSVYGIELTTLFNPLLRPGGKVQVKSGLEVANGTWQVFNMSHELQSEDPGGQWYTRFSGASLNG